VDVACLADLEDRGSRGAGAITVAAVPAVVPAADREEALAADRAAEAVFPADQAAALAASAALAESDFPVSPACPVVQGFPRFPDVAVAAAVSDETIAI
jgi:hypothetical protein